MTNFNDVTKLYNRPFEEMSLLELYAEIGVHNWHKQRMKYDIERLKKRRWWLDQNKPIPAMEELQQQYEDGQMTKRQFAAARARRQQAIYNLMHLEEREKYAHIVIAHEEAVVAYLDELKTELQAKEAEAERRRRAGVRARSQGNKKYDPRRNANKYNINKTLDPNRRWATREEPKPIPTLQRARARWKDAQHSEGRAMSISKKMQPILTWDVDKLRDIAKDRGFYTDLAMVGQIAEVLNITMTGAQKLIDSGRLSWSQCIIIGALFEMTPKEFCDTFMSGYFREVADGVFRAYVEDTDALLDKPYQPRAKEISEDEEGQV